jgi:probable rRNA maturation factor
MTTPQISISINKKLKVSLKKSWIRSVVLEALKTEGIMTPVEMGLVVTDNKTVQQLNRNYRDVDEPTDVLAFHMPFYKKQEPELPFVNPPDGVLHLGEVVISYPQAIQQAREQSHSVEQELALLIIHGVLHIVGYDHEEPEEEQHMRAKEKEIMRKLNTAWSDK